jgi:hypothetical protein
MYQSEIGPYASSDDGQASTALLMTSSDNGVGVGTRVGVPVGTGVGESVGDSVGFGVGDSVGDPVGTGVGDAVGTGLGDAVGTNVGDAVGNGVGATVGASVGDPVGVWVGAAVSRILHKPVKAPVSHRLANAGGAFLWILVTQTQNKTTRAMVQTPKNTIQNIQ